MMFNKNTYNILQSRQIKKYYKILWLLLTQQQKNKFKIILLLLVVSSFFEILSLGSLLPFIAVIVSPETIFTNEHVGPIVYALGWNTAEKVQINFTIAYISIIIMTAIFRALLKIFEVKFIYSIGTNISRDIYKSYLLRPYSEYVLSNSSEILSDLTHKVGELISSWLAPTLNLLVAIILLIVTIATLVWISPILMLSTFGVFAIIYLVTIFFFKESVHKNTEIVSISAEKIIKEIQEASGNIRDIMLHQRQKQYSNVYNLLESNLRRSQAQIQILSFVPKVIIETLGVVFIAILAYILSISSENVVDIAVGLGLVVVGVQKILPLLNQIYNDYIILRVGVKVGGRLLTRNKPLVINKSNRENSEKIKFDSHIILKDISFRYSEKSDLILKQASFKIKKNSCIGVMGRSGSGKSTLSDILLGMLMPTSGTMYVDNAKIVPNNIRAWKKRVAHVPQSVYLIDDSILKNIIIDNDLDNIDHDKLEYALRLSSLQEFISTQEDGILSSVGERGMRLSGGQRQRIGIARAIYEGADFLIFDEPTSALDPETEKTIMSAISMLSGQVTIVLISHNVDNLKICDSVIKIHNGVISQQKT